MSSFGSGGGSSSGSTGHTMSIQPLGGLGLDQLARQMAMGQQQAKQVGIVPGQAAKLSPQQRLAAVMQQYSGG